MEALADKFFKKTARIENMVLLAGVLPCDSFPDTLRDFFQEEEPAGIKECFGDIPDDIMDELEDNEEAVAQWLIEQRKLGFLVQIATPTRRWRGDVATYSWGSYYTKWVYGDTLDAALDRGFSWCEEMRAKDKQKVEA